MKFRQLFLFAVMLVVLTLAMTACNLPFELPFDIPFLNGTDPSETTTEPEATTTAAIVTLPPVTAAPNPITKVKKMSTNELLLTHKRNNTLTTFEPSLGETEDYTAVSYSYSFDASSGILTLHLTTTPNLLSTLLGAPTNLTVRIKENNQMLEWAYEASDTWVSFCRTGKTDDKPLAQLCESTGFAEKTARLEDRLNAEAGHNGVIYNATFNEDNSILTLTMYDNMVQNIALAHLATNLPAPITICLRKNGTNIEWTYKDSDAWTVLCGTHDKTAQPLALLRQATSFAINATPTETGVYLSIQDGKLRFRAREWKVGTDLCMDTVLTGSSNKVFNINALTEVSSSVPFTDVSSGTTWKGTSDDITPININGTYIGANHGYFIIAAIPNDSTNKKTEADIGSIWKVGNQQYVLVKVDVVPKEDRNGPPRLWFCPISDTMMETGVFTNHSIPAGATIEHVSGATNKDSITTEEASLQCQYYNALNHNKMAAYLNGTVEVDIYTNGVYNAEFIDFYEEYDIIYLPTMLRYLIDNVGENTNNSHCDESLNDAYVTFKNTYRYHKNGACVVYSSYVFHKTVNMSYIGGVQSGPFYTNVCSDACPKNPNGTKKYATADACRDSGEGHVPLAHYVYIPGAIGYTTPTQQFGVAEGKNVYPNVNIGKNILVDPDYLTTTYFQLTSPDGAKAINLGFNPEFGFGVNETRWDYVSNSSDGLAFYYQNSYKMYPKLISGGTVAAGTVIDVIAYRLPSEKTDDDFFAINWYWVGDDIYLSLHTAKTVEEKTVALPDYMNGMTITPVEISDSFNIISETINGGITVSTTDAGYTIVKLSPAQ